MTMRAPSILLLALALGALSAVALGCGGKTNPHRIPSGSAQKLDDQLDRVRSAVADGDCTGALPGRLQALQSSVTDLPSQVDPRLRLKLQQGVANLVKIAPPQCAAGATTTTDTTTTETVPTTTTETTPTVTTDTTATETTPTTTVPTTPATTPAPPVLTTTVAPGGGASAPTPTTP